MISKKYIIIFIVSLFLYSICYSLTNEEQLAKLIPPSNWEKDWQWDDDPHDYYPDNLYEYIDGAADLYLSYGFKSLISVSYVSGEDLSVFVDIYDMGSSLNAFGIFSNYRSPDNQFEKIGTEAVVSDYNIRFYHGSYIVDVNGSDSIEPISSFMKKVAIEIANRINVPSASPRILSLLPENNLIEKSSKYVAKALMGHEFFPKGLEAKYKIGNTEAQIFIVIFDTDNLATNAFKQFIDFINQKGENPVEQEKENQTIITGKLPYHEFMIASKINRFIYGVVDLPQANEGQELLSQIKQKILSTTYE